MQKKKESGKLASEASHGLKKCSTGLVVFVISKVVGATKERVLLEERE